METLSLLQYAYQPRESKEAIAIDYELINSLEYFKDIINSISTISLLLNKSRQIVFASNDFLSLIGQKTMEPVLGLRPGESISCIHANEEIGGCGTAVACNLCGGLNAIIECQQSNHITAKETRITSNINEAIISWDFLISASLIKIQNKEFIVVTFKDISDEKKRQIFEKMFFHDINNVTIILNGFATKYIKITDDKKRDEFIGFIERASSAILDQITSYRQLLEAENSELEVRKIPVNTSEIIHELVNIVSNYEILKSNIVMSDPEMMSVTIITDKTLLSRILLNMLKNAVEAVSDKNDSKITIGVKKENDAIRFWVHNESIISEQVQLQIFQRSYSTKGAGRGLGTYSMKIFGENYLKGKVGFISNENAGTVFYFDLQAE